MFIYGGYILYYSSFTLTMIDPFSCRTNVFDEVFWYQTFHDFAIIRRSSLKGN